MQNEQGKLEEAFIMHERCYEMRQTIHGEECAYTDIADSLNILGLVHQNQEKLEDGVKG